jgi:endonuclease/exonuclease/phosphatase family metal-dependent hydrolase
MIVLRVAPILLLLCAVALPDAGVTPLLENGSPSRPRSTSCTGEAKIVSYNIAHRSGSDLEKLAATLRNDPDIGNADIIGLQEVDRNKKRSRYANNARILADELGMSYVWAAPPATKDDQEEETGVVLLSAHSMKEMERIVLPHKGPGGRRRVAVGATIEMCSRRIRVYCIHAENRMSPDEKAEQFSALVESLSKYPSTKRAIFLGDFNTVSTRNNQDARRLFTSAGFTTPFADGLETWRVFMIAMQLDWIWLRGLEATANGVAGQINHSDHSPVWVRFKWSD